MLSDDAKSSMGDSSKKMVMEGYQNYTKKKKKKVIGGNQRDTNFMVFDA